jgi:hypothetical protein
MHTRNHAQEHRALCNRAQKAYIAKQAGTRGEAGDAGEAGALGGEASGVSGGAAGETAGETGGEGKEEVVEGGKENEEEDPRTVKKTEKVLTTAGGQTENISTLKATADETTDRINSTDATIAGADAGVGVGVVGGAVATAQQQRCFYRLVETALKDIQDVLAHEAPQYSCHPHTHKALYCFLSGGGGEKKGAVSSNIPRKAPKREFAADVKFVFNSLGLSCSTRWAGSMIVTKKRNTRKAALSEGKEGGKEGGKESEGKEGSGGGVGDDPSDGPSEGTMAGTGERRDNGGDTGGGSGGSGGNPMRDGGASFACRESFMAIEPRSGDRPTDINGQGIHGHPVGSEAFEGSGSDGGYGRGEGGARGARGEGFTGRLEGEEGGGDGGGDGGERGDVGGGTSLVVETKRARGAVGERERRREARGEPRGGSTGGGVGGKRQASTSKGTKGRKGRQAPKGELVKPSVEIMIQDLQDRRFRQRGSLGDLSEGVDMVLGGEKVAVQVRQRGRESERARDREKRNLGERERETEREKQRERERIPRLYRLPLY